MTPCGISEHFARVSFAHQRESFLQGMEQTFRIKIISAKNLFLRKQCSIALVWPHFALPKPVTTWLPAFSRTSSSLRVSSSSGHSLPVRFILFWLVSVIILVYCPQNYLKAQENNLIWSSLSFCPVGTMWSSKPSISFLNCCLVVSFIISKNITRSLLSISRS